MSHEIHGAFAIALCKCQENLLVLVDWFEQTSAVDERCAVAFEKDIRKIPMHLRQSGIAGCDKDAAVEGKVGLGCAFQVSSAKMAAHFRDQGAQCFDAVRRDLGCRELRCVTFDKQTHLKNVSLGDSIPEPPAM